MTKLLLLLVSSTLLAAAADVTGKWSGSFLMTRDGEQRDDTAFMDLKQDGAKITGIAGPHIDKTFPIKTGVIEGNKIKLEVANPDGPVIYFTLTVDGDRITGDAKADGDGHTLSAKVDIKREK